MAIISSLKFTGADHSTTFTDESGKAWTGGVGAEIIGDRLSLSGANYISTPDHADWNLGSDDLGILFDIESAVDMANGIQWLLFTQVDAYGTGWVIMLARNDSLYGGTIFGLAELSSGVPTGNAFIVPGLNPILQDVHDYWEITRVGNAFKLFRNGAQQGATQTLAITFPESDRPVVVGHGINGLLDNVLVCKGQYASIPVADMILVGLAPVNNIYYIPVADMPLIGHAPSRCADIPVVDMPLSEYTPSYFMIAPIPLATMLLLARNPSYVWTLPLSMRPSAQVIFYCILTGADDGLDDIALPMSSFSARLRDGEPSYISCVIPDSLTWEDAITARSNGDIIIQKGVRLIDGTEQMEEIARVDFESLQIDRGANSDSATITGHRTVTSSAPKDWTVEGVSFYGLQSDGKRRIRAGMDLFLRCGDTCIYDTGGNDYFVVGAITYFVSAKPPMFLMDVTES